MTLSERLNTPISTAELERRWTAVRAAMEVEKIDVLLMQNNNDHMGGYVKYFTDLPATNGYPMTVVFPRDDRMTIVGQGPFGMVKDLPDEGDGVRRGVKTWMTTPSYASAHYTASYDPELAAKALDALCGRHDRARRPLPDVGRARRPPARGRLSNSKFVDASDLVDHIKVIKSPEEIELIKRAARMQDGAMRAAFEAVKPGMREADVAASPNATAAARRRERHLPVCVGADRNAVPDRAAALSEPDHPRGRLRWCCWSRTAARAASTPSSAAPACSARCRSR